jgi:putative DNA primase/helicase
LSPVAQPGISDDDLAMRFSARYSDDLRYVPAWNAWLLRDGARWTPDEKRAVFNLARAICREAGEELASKANGDEAKRRIRARTGSARTISNVVRLARTDPRHAVAVEWATEQGLRRRRARGRS